MWLTPYYLSCCHGRISSEMFTCSGVVSDVRGIVKSVYASYGRAKNNKPDGTRFISITLSSLPTSLLLLTTVLSLTVVKRDYLPDALSLHKGVLRCSDTFVDLNVMWMCLVHSWSSSKYDSVSRRWAYVRVMYSHTRWKAKMVITWPKSTKRTHKCRAATSARVTLVFVKWMQCIQVVNTLNYWKVILSCAAAAATLLLAPTLVHYEVR